MKQSNKSNGKFGYLGNRDLSVFGKAETQIYDFVQTEGRNTGVFPHDVDVITNFLGSTPFGAMITSVYNSMMEHGFINLCTAYTEFLLFDHLRKPNTYPILMKLMPKTRDRIIKVTRKFKNWFVLLSKKDTRVEVLLSQINKGYFTISSISEDFRCELPFDKDLSEADRIVLDAAQRHKKIYDRDYEWFRAAVNTLWREKFLNRQIDLLSALRSQRGWANASLYYTHVALKDDLLNFIYMIKVSTEGSVSKRYVKKIKDKQEEPIKITTNGKNSLVCECGAQFTIQPNVVYDMNYKTGAYMCLKCSQNNTITKD